MDLIPFHQHIEESFINQIMIITGNQVFLESYYGNLGIHKIKESLQELIPEESKSYQLFRNIELNFQIRNNSSSQNVLGSIQQSILDYLERKLEILIEFGDYNAVTKTLNMYEQMLITPEKLQMMRKNPKNYIQLPESIEKFNEIKNKYLEYSNTDNRGV